MSKIGSREGAKMSRVDDVERFARIAVDCGFHIHNDLGPGLLESAYEALLAEGLRQEGLGVKRQVSLSLNYRGVTVDHAFKVDLLIEDCLIIELKSVEKTLPVHGKQLLTYLRLSNLPLGLLMNFGQPMFKDGLKRVVNGHRSNRFGH